MKSLETFQDISVDIHIKMSYINSIVTKRSVHSMMNNVVKFPTLNRNTQFDDAPITILNDEAINDNNRMVWDLDNTACMSVADGSYPVRYTALDASAVNNQDWFFYTIESHDTINVIDGQFDVASVLHTAQHLMDISGYWGVYVEALEWNEQEEYFDLVVGS